MQNVQDYIAQFNTESFAIFASDIKPELARSAYYNLSHSPERTGAVAIRDYCIEVENLSNGIQAAVRRALKNGARVCDDWEAVFSDQMTQARETLSRYYSDYLSSKSACASSFITGGSNFPVESQRKRHQWADNKYSAYLEVIEKIQKGIIKRLLPDGDGTQIRSDSDNAVEQIEKKVAELENSQEMMKQVNKLVRHELTKVADRAQLTDDEKEHIVSIIVMKFAISESSAYSLIKPDYMGRIVPFASYSLTNNNANIKRYKDRLVEQRRLEESRQSESNDVKNSFENGIETGITEDNKIYINFPVERIERDDFLKLTGYSFKYSRTRGMFVRKHTANAEAVFLRNVKPFLISWTC